MTVVREREGKCGKVDERRVQDGKGKMVGIFRFTSPFLVVSCMVR